MARLDRLLAQGAAVSSRYTRWRLAIFLTGAAVCITFFHQRWFHLGNASLVLFLAIFLIVARYHSRLEDRLQRLRGWRHLKAVHLARLHLDWPAIPFRPVPVPEGHPYARDLDLVGPHSLLHLLDTTHSSNGRRRLAAWLLEQPPPPIEWTARQALIRELTGLPLFRDRLALEAMRVSEAELDGDRIHAALTPPIGFPLLIPLLGIQALLAAATLSLASAAAIAGVPQYWVLTFGLYAAIYFLSSDRIDPVFGRALSLHQELDKLGAVFRYLERRRHLTPALADLCRGLTTGRARPSAAIGRLARVAQALSIRAHPLVHLAVNAVGPWDLFFTHRLERVRASVLQHMPGWLETLAQLDAAAALGNFAYLHPAYVWPAVRSTEEPARNGHGPGVAAKALGHPLLPAAQRVANDLHLTGVGTVLLVTGSNMSGKSTFLRTLGINTCLAQAGGPVCAASFEWTWLRIRCCIRVDDSLEAGLSFFYAEVKRLRQILDAARDWRSAPVLFLIDEIFKGTNNRERLIGSRAYIRALAGGHALGLVTTHDLELAELDGTVPGLKNAHFQETVAANQLRFDYLLRPGPCPTTNALRIMALEGLPIAEGREPERPPGEGPAQPDR